MESVTFALPTVASSGMSRDDQNILLVNQATAIIVAAFLDHKNAVLEMFGKRSTDPNDRSVAVSAVIDSSELVRVIDRVQGALRQI